MNKFSQQLCRSAAQIDASLRSNSRSIRVKPKYQLPRFYILNPTLVETWSRYSTPDYLAPSTPPAHPALSHAPHSPAGHQAARWHWHRRRPTTDGAERPAAPEQGRNTCCRRALRGFRRASPPSLAQETAAASAPLRLDCRKAADPAPWLCARDSTLKPALLAPPLPAVGALAR